MNVRTYTLVTSFLFALFAAVHLLRLVMQWDVELASWHVPMWASVVAMFVAGALSFVGFRGFQQIQKHLT